MVAEVETGSSLRVWKTGACETVGKEAGVSRRLLKTVGSRAVLRHEQSLSLEASLLREETVRLSSFPSCDLMRHSRLTLAAVGPVDFGQETFGQLTQQSSPNGL